MKVFFEETYSLTTWVASTGLPLVQHTPRLSPQFAMIRYFCDMSAHTAVVPDLSSPLATSGIFRSFSSSSKNPFRMPFLIPSMSSSCDSVCSCWRLQVKSSEALQSNQILFKDAIIQNPTWCNLTDDENSVPTPESRRGRQRRRTRRHCPSGPGSRSLRSGRPPSRSSSPAWRTARTGARLPPWTHCIFQF